MKYKIQQPGEGNKEAIKNFIEKMDKFFTPTLASRVNIEVYCNKIFKNATKFIYEEKGDVIALCIVYVNEAPKESFGTYLAVLPEYATYGLGLDLVRKAIKYAKSKGSSSFRVKIRASNKMLYKFYQLQGLSKVNEENYPNSDIVEYELVKLFN